MVSGRGSPACARACMSLHSVTPMAMFLTKTRLSQAAASPWDAGKPWLDICNTAYYFFLAHQRKFQAPLSKFQTPSCSILCTSCVQGTNLSSSLSNWTSRGRTKGANQICSTHIQQLCKSRLVNVNVQITARVPVEASHCTSHCTCHCTNHCVQTIVQVTVELSSHVEELFFFLTTWKLFSKVQFNLHLRLHHTHQQQPYRLPCLS